MRLVPFTVALARMSMQDRARFGAALGVRVPEDWPNEDFRSFLPLLVDRLGDGLETWTFWVVADGAVAGEIGAKGLPDPTGIIEVGYGVAASERGRGVATRALRAFVAQAFTRGATVVRAEVLVANLASVRVVEKAGFLPAGGGVGEEGPFGWWERRAEA